MTKYHSDDYIKFLRSIRPDNMSEYSKQMQRCTFVRGTVFMQTIKQTAMLRVTATLCLSLCCCFAVNVGEDCPVFDGLFEFCQLSVGGSVGKPFHFNYSSDRHAELNSNHDITALFLIC